MKLLNVLRNKPICNDFHFILFGLIILIVSVKYHIFIILFFVYLIFIYKKISYIIIPLVIVSLVFILRFLSCNKELAYIDEVEGIYYIDDISDKYYYLKGEYNVICYKYYEDLDIGDKINCNIKIYQWDELSYEHEFDYKEYYKAKNIDYRGYIKEYEVIGYRFNENVIKHKIIDFYDKKLDDKSFSYFKALVLGINDIEDDVKDAYSSLYISHILAISGMHLVFIYKVLVSLFRFLFKIEGEVFSLIIITLYLVIIGFPIAGLRAYLFLVLGYLNNLDKIKYTKLDIFSISFIIMTLFNPLICYQSSFILSYLVSFLLIFINDIVSVKSKLLNSFITSLLSILITFPFVINMTNEVNIINIFLSLFINIIVTTFLMPITFMLVVFPSLPTQFIYSFLDNYLITISNNIKPINFPSFNVFMCVIYYVLLILMLIKKKYFIGLFGLFLIFVLNVNNLSSYYKITFIDVGQGDSILIEYPYRKSVVLIDSFNNVKYLKSIGINKVDAIFLSHNDIDHVGSIDDVISDFKIDNIYRSYYEESFSFNTIPLKSKDVINVNNICFEILGPIKDYKDSNSNSLVIKFMINKFSFLFTGDASILSEEDLVNVYGNYLSSFFFKVGHHGSITSSSDNFLRFVKPKYSFISVGKNNKYDLPDEVVIDKLIRYGKVYQTSLNGNISIYIKDDDFEIKEYRVSK